MTIRRTISNFLLVAGVICILCIVHYGESLNNLSRYGLIYLSLLLIFVAQITSGQTLNLEDGQNPGKKRGLDNRISTWNIFGWIITPSAFLTIVTVFIFSALSITLLLPSPLKFIQDQDWAHQLAGANQILKGQHPFITFLDVYGPLTFYASAFTQIIFSTRVIGEIFLIVLGFSSAYTIFYWLMWSISRDRLLAFILLTILLVLVPRLYKYYIILGPALTLFFLWIYVEHPSYKNLWMVGLAVVITGLFRPDFGIYMILSAAIAMLFQKNFTIKKNFVNLFYFCGILLVIASPWLIFVGTQGGLQDYLYNSTIGMVTTGVGMSLPVSVSQDILSLKNLQLLAKIAFNLIPALSLFVFFLDSHAPDLSTRPILFALIVASQLTLIQGLHRSDYEHLLQAVPTTFILLAYLLKHAANLFTTKKNMLSLIGLGLGIGLLSIMLFFSLPKWKDISMSKTLNNLALYNLRRDQFTEGLIQQYPNSDLLQAMNFIRKCTNPDDKIITWPYLVDFYYFTNRPLGGRLKAIGPIFTGSSDQEVVVHDMKTDDILFYVYRPMAFSPTAREIRDYAPIVANYLEETYVPVEKFGNIIVHIRHDNESSFICPSQ
ncbi:MAG: hypothetical protein HZB18_16675 [Chloroflexi bacterium]|nr:hypothetical protein [Chloroflexota bacterium]